MEKEFIPYEQALALKELGFDEPCMGRYYSQNKDLPIFMQWTKAEDFNNIKLELPYNQSPFISAPLYQQAFRWFREKYGLDCSFDDEIVEDENDNEIEMWDFFIYKTKQKSDNKVMSFCSNNYNTYIESYSREEAELECLKKLIEIVKNR